MSYFQIESSRGSTVNGNALIMLYVYNGRWAIYISGQRPLDSAAKEVLFWNFLLPGNEVKIMVVFNGRLFSILP